MARGRKKDNLEEVNRQIEAAEELVIRKKKEYDAATDNLKELLDKKRVIQTDELAKAFMKSKHSYEEIMQFINSDLEEGTE